MSITELVNQYNEFADRILSLEKTDPKLVSFIENLLNTASELDTKLNKKRESKRWQYIAEETMITADAFDYMDNNLNNF